MILQLIRYFVAIGLVSLLCGTVSAYDMVPNGKQNKPVLLINGTIHTITGATIENGQLLFENGKILAIGKELKTPPDCEVLDITDKHVYPGMISPDSSIGHIEINSVRATVDTGELGDLNPSLRAEVAVNPDSEVIPVTRANGVLFAHVTPLTSRGGRIAGKSALIKLDGWTTEEMILEAPVSMRLSWPRDPQVRVFDIEPSSIANPKKAEETYAESIKKLEEAFDDARAFTKAKSVQGDRLAVDLGMEAMEPVLNGELPVHIEASTARQIRDAVLWANKEGVNAVIVGGYDAWRVTDLLKQYDIPVIVGRVNSPPTRRWESFDSRFKNAAKLHAAGVRFAIGYSNREANERNLPYEAGKAVAHGLPLKEALKALTIYPAEILGVSDRIGSLEVGKDASLIVTSGNPMDVRTNVEMAFIDGRAVDLSSRHTQLYNKYEQRYQQN